jgi:hypothetical protein
MASRKDGIMAEPSAPTSPFLETLQGQLRASLGKLDAWISTMPRSTARQAWDAWIASSPVHPGEVLPDLGTSFLAGEAKTSDRPEVWVLLRLLYAIGQNQGR